MKKFLIVVLACCLGTAVLPAQSQREIAKERREIAKLSRTELNAKASKAARKAARTLSRAGWTVAPGQLPLEKQLDKAYNMQYQYDEAAFPKFIMGEAMSVGENYDAAKIQALELAKLNLAAQVQTEVTALVESSVANKQLASDEAASLTETLLASKNLISQRLGRTIPVVECYRMLKNGNREVRVQIAYDSKAALEAAKNVVRDELEAKGDRLHDQLDRVMGF